MAAFTFALEILKSFKVYQKTQIANSSATTRKFGFYDKFKFRNVDSSHLKPNTTYDKGHQVKEGYEMLPKEYFEEQKKATKWSRLISEFKKTVHGKQKQNNTDKKPGKVITSSKQIKQNIKEDNSKQIKDCISLLHSVANARQIFYEMKNLTISPKRNKNKLGFKQSNKIDDPVDTMSKTQNKKETKNTDNIPQESEPLKPSKKLQNSSGILSLFCTNVDNTTYLFYENKLTKELIKKCIKSYPKYTDYFKDRHTVQDKTVKRGYNLNTHFQSIKPLIERLKERGGTKTFPTTHKNNSARQFKYKNFFDSRNKCKKDKNKKEDKPQLKTKANPTQRRKSKSKPSRAQTVPEYKLYKRKAGAQKKKQFPNYKRYFDGEVGHSNKYYLDSKDMDVGRKDSSKTYQTLYMNYFKKVFRKNMLRKEKQKLIWDHIEEENNESRLYEIEQQLKPSKLKIKLKNEREDFNMESAIIINHFSNRYKNKLFNKDTKK